MPNPVRKVFLSAGNKLELYNYLVDMYRYRKRNLIVNTT